MVMTVPVTIDPRYYDAVIFYLDGAAATDGARIDAAAWTQSADGVPLNVFRDNGAVTAMGRGVLANFPTAALGALVVFAALRLINFAGIPTWGRMALGTHERTADT
jgi:hypothetical protein